MIDVQHGALRAFEHHALSGRDRLVQQSGGIAHHGANALGEATTRIRQKLGESLASVQRFDVPLAKATTASLDALHAYSLALSEGSEVPRLEAIPHLERAIELDPQTKALMTSGYTEDIAVDPEQAIGSAIRLLRKPYRQAELKQTIREVLSL